MTFLTSQKADSQIEFWHSFLAQLKIKSRWWSNNSAEVLYNRWALDVGA
jgi:hypothetical protein